MTRLPRHFAGLAITRTCRPRLLDLVLGAGRCGRGFFVTLLTVAAVTCLLGCPLRRTLDLNDDELSSSASSFAHPGLDRDAADKMTLLVQRCSESDLDCI